MTETIIQMQDIEKSFNGVQVLKSMSFNVDRGEILCLLGPNGAGKSTTINILSAALPAERGAVYYKGKSVHGATRAYTRQLGIVPQDIAIFADISAEANVRFFASLYGWRGRALADRTAWALDFVGLSHRRRDKPKTFSGGMKRRLNIACALAHDPEVIIMDEPTVGIDPQSRNHILNSIQQLRAAGKTIIYTTHYMEEVEAISTRIIVMDSGAIIASGTKEELKSAFDSGRLYTIQIDNLDKIIADFHRQQVTIRHITSTVPSLETVFLQLTGRSLRDGKGSAARTGRWGDE